MNPDRAEPQLRRKTRRRLAAPPHPAPSAPSRKLPGKVRQLLSESDRLLGERNQSVPELELRQSSLKVQCQELQTRYQELQSRCSHYANLYDFAPVGYVIFDARGIIQEINKAAALLLGWEHARVVRSPFLGFVHPPDAPGFLRHLHQCRNAPGRVTTELTLVCRSGALLPVQLISAPFRSPADHFIQYRTALIDISERRQAEEVLRRLQRNYQALVDSLEGIVWEGKARARSWQFTFVSKQARRLLGYPVKRWTAEPGFWQNHIHPEDQPRVLETCTQALVTGRNYLIEYRMITAAGQVVWLRDNVSVSRQPNGELKLSGLMVNISEVKEAEHALRRAYDELEHRVSERTLDLTRAYEELQLQIQERRRLEGELLEITDKERHRIALDLHDDLGQRLAGISLMLKSLQVKLAKQGLPVAAEAQKIHEVVTQTVDRTHDLTHDLTAWEVRQKDLPGALADLAGRVESLFGIACRFKMKGAPPPLSDTALKQIYKIAQEAVTNAIKHGPARRVAIRLDTAGEQSSLTITNDGRPFPKLVGVSNGMGLRIMSYRASLIGASVDVRPNGPRGTVVSCRLPPAPTNGQ